MYSRNRRRTHSGEVRRDSLHKFRPILGGNWYCLIENRFLYIECKERSIDGTSALMFVLSIQECYGVFSHDVTTAIMVSQNNETAAMLVFQTSPVGVELLSYANKTLY